MIVQIDKNFDPGPFWPIPLTNKLYAIVSPEDYEEIRKFKWYAKKSFSKHYAKRSIRTKSFPKYVFMHRQIAHTPNNEVCHHINGNSLDNRRLNLQNMEEYTHRKLHSWR